MTPAKKPPGFSPLRWLQIARRIGIDDAENGRTNVSQDQAADMAEWCMAAELRLGAPDVDRASEVAAELEPEGEPQRVVASKLAKALGRRPRSPRKMYGFSVIEYSWPRYSSVREHAHTWPLYGCRCVMQPLTAEDFAPLTPEVVEVAGQRYEYVPRTKLHIDDRFVVHLGLEPETETFWPSKGSEYVWRLL